MANVSGPLFDGRAENALREFVNEAEEDVADEGKQMVLERLGHVLREPTGFYESNITKTRIGNDWLIHDNGVVYGPWLEGVGSRNSPVTRFPGYFTFRIVRDELDVKAGGIAEQVFFKYKPRLG